MPRCAGAVRGHLHLDAAREIACRKLTGLDQVEHPEWWRMPERTALLDGLLALHKVVASASSRGRGN